MSIWSIADLHASRTDPSTGRPSKPMDIFGPQWKNHIERLEMAWCRSIQPEDYVIVAGDIDWALHLEDAFETLARIHSWPGTKVLLRGNHDYWWSSKSTARVRAALPSSLHALHNDAIQVEGFNICGTKGSPVPGGFDWSPQDAKLLNREEQRLALSLGAREQALATIVAFHFPPFYPATGSTGYRRMVEEAETQCVVYGHLHGDARTSGPTGYYGNVPYRLVAGDAVDFQPVLLVRDGALVREKHLGRVSDSC